MPCITINQRSMHYHDSGEGDVLLFGHSYLWDHNMWRAQIAFLSEHYRCIVPDLWGHGDSEAVPEGAVTIQSLADDHWALMQALEIEQFTVIGLSVGGMWGTRLALDHPDAVKRLVIMGSFVGVEPEEPKARYFGMLDIVEQVGAIPLPMIEQLLPIIFSPETLKREDEVVTEYARALAAIPPEMIPSVVTLGRAIFGRPDMLPELPQLKMPTLVLCGEDDHPRPPHEAQEMAELIPGAQLQLIPQAGHISALEQPQRVNELLAQFLDVSL